MSWSGDSKVYNRGPDEDGQHYQRTEKRHNDRLMAKGRRLSGGGGGEPGAFEERKLLFRRCFNDRLTQIHTEALSSLRTYFNGYDGQDRPKIVVQAGKKKGTFYRLCWI
jgi:hypothetical protein